MKYPFVLLVAFLAIFFSGCSGGGGYYYQPSDSDAQSQSTTPQSPTAAPPNAPYDLSATATSQSVVTLQWTDNSDNEEGFMIYRDSSIIGTVGANIITYQDTSLEAGKTYQYTVKAYNAAGESGACFCNVKTLNPSLNVTINYIGVKFDHDPSELFQGPGDIRLAFVVSDGKQTIEEIIPPGEGSYQLNDYETTELNQRIFHTDSAGEYLKVCIIAYDDDPETLVSDLLQAALPVLGPLVGIPDVSGISSIFSAYEEQTGKPLFENKDDYVGYFEGLWGSDESWGIGQHNAVGTEDFRVWLSIWSDNQPSPMPKPTLSPDVTIQSVDVPAEVEVGRNYTYNVTLRNDETSPVIVTLKIYSSATGDVSSQSVTVPANSAKDVPQTTHFEPAGVRTVTYTIFYNGQELDSVSRTVEAVGTEAPGVLTVDFDGWYVGGSEVTTASKGDVVTARITLTSGDSGQYTIRIRRDIVWASDETVNELLFSYGGASDTITLSFTPPYATGEANTDGYHIDLVKDGYIVWTLTDAYPPRLRVNFS
jgi:hypothetical protein